MLRFLALLVAHRQVVSVLFENRRSWSPIFRMELSGEVHAGAFFERLTELQFL